MFVTGFEAVQLSKKESDYVRKFLVGDRLNKQRLQDIGYLRHQPLTRKHLEYTWMDTKAPLVFSFKFFVEESIDQRVRVLDWQWNIHAVSDLAGTVRSTQLPKQQFYGSGKWMYVPDKQQLLFQYDGECKFTHYDQPELAKQLWLGTPATGMTDQQPGLIEEPIQFRLQFILQLQS